MKIKIREQSSDDRAAVAAVTEAAFASTEFGHNGESALVGSLCDAVPSCLSWVANSQEGLVGHILFSPAELRLGRESLRGMALAPMSVAPDCQRQGVGSKLVKEGLREIAYLGCPFVIVLGHADYYPRFGFEPASKFDIGHGFDGVPQDFFFIRELSEGTLDAWRGASAYYRPEFGPQHS